MQMKMLLTPSELDSVISKLETCASDLGSLIARIDSIMSQLEVEWAGSAQVAYAETYDQIKTRSLIPTKQLLENYPQTLRQAKSDFSFSDGDSARAIKGKLGGILPSKG